MYHSSFLVHSYLYDNSSGFQCSSLKSSCFSQRQFTGYVEWKSPEFSPKHVTILAQSQLCVYSLGTASSTLWCTLNFSPSLYRTHVCHLVSPAAILFSSCWCATNAYKGDMVCWSQWLGQYNGPHSHEHFHHTYASQVTQACRSRLEHPAHPRHRAGNCPICEPSNGSIDGPCQSGSDTYTWMSLVEKIW